MQFEDYVSARGPSLLRFAFVLSGDRHVAEDLVQDALARCFIKWDRIQALEHIDAYVKKILANRYIDLRKRRSGNEVVVDPWDLRSSAGPQAGTSESALESVSVWNALATLPPRQRAVIVLQYYEDLDNARIADILNCSQATVRSNAMRALGALRRSGALHDTERTELR